MTACRWPEKVKHPTPAAAHGGTESEENEHGALTCAARIVREGGRP